MRFQGLELKQPRRGSSAAPSCQIPARARGQKKMVRRYFGRTQMMYLFLCIFRFYFIRQTQFERTDRKFIPLFPTSKVRLRTRGFHHEGGVVAVVG